MLKQLFQITKKDELGDLIRCIEKISKVIKLSIGEEDTRIVNDNLKWLENFFYSLFNLRKTDYRKYIALIDPDSRHKSVEVDIDFWNNLDFSKIIELPPQEESNKNLVSLPLYNSVADNSYYERDIINIISNCIYRIWEISYQKKDLDTCRSCILILANWINHIDKIRDDKNVRYRNLIEYLVNTLRSINVTQSKNKNPVRYFLTHYTSYSVWLSLVFKENTDLTNTDYYFAQVFSNIQFAISHGNDNVFLDFIKHCTHSTYNSFHITDNNTALTTKYRKNLNVTRDLYDMQKLAGDVYTKKQREELLKLFKDKLEQTENFQNDDLTAIDTYLVKALKYNQLQLQVFKLSAYLLFKRRYATLLSAFNFNQPDDSAAIWSNKDMFPVSFYETLVLIKNKGIIEDELRFGFEDHHGAEIYINQLLLILLYRNIKKSQDLISEFKSFVNEQKSSNELENLKYGFRDVIQSRLPLAKFDFDHDRVQRVNDLLENVEEIIKVRSESIIQSLPIDEDTKASYCSNVSKSYLQDAYFKHLIEFFGQVETEQIVQWEGVEYGINLLFPREAFINYHIPYYGLSESAGRALSENENMIIANTLSSLSRKEYIDESKLLDRLSGLNEDYLIIGINVFFDSLLVLNENYTKKWDNERYNNTSLERFYMGTYGEADIFNYYTSSSISKIYLLKKESIKYIKRYLIPNNGYIKDKSCDYLFFTFLDLNNEADFNKYKSSLSVEMEENTIIRQKRLVNFKAIHFFETSFSDDSITELILNGI